MDYYERRAKSIMREALMEMGKEVLGANIKATGNPFTTVEVIEQLANEITDKTYTKICEVTSGVL